MVGLTTPATLCAHADAVRTQRNTVRVFLLSLENSEWKVLARYD